MIKTRLCDFGVIVALIAIALTSFLVARPSDPDAAGRVMEDMGSLDTLPDDSASREALAGYLPYWAMIGPILLLGTAWILTLSRLRKPARSKPIPRWMLLTATASIPAAPVTLMYITDGVLRMPTPTARMISSGIGLVVIIGLLLATAILVAIGHRRTWRVITGPSAPLVLALPTLLALPGWMIKGIQVATESCPPILASDSAVAAVLGLLAVAIMFGAVLIGSRRYQRRNPSTDPTDHAEQPVTTSA